MGVFMYKSQNGGLPDIFITIIKHTMINIVEKLEMLMLYMYHIADLTSEELAWESLVLMCGIRFQYKFRDPNPLQCLCIDYDVTWLIGGYMCWFNFMYVIMYGACILCILMTVLWWNDWWLVISQCN